MNDKPKRDEIEEIEERLGDLYSMTSEEYGDLAWWLVKKAAWTVLAIGLCGLFLYLVT